MERRGNLARVRFPRLRARRPDRAGRDLRTRRGPAVRRAARRGATLNGRVNDFLVGNGLTVGNTLRASTPEIGAVLADMLAAQAVTEGG